MDTVELEQIGKNVWRLRRDVVIYGISVPRGFITDLASIPRVFYFIGKRTDENLQRASIVHDYMLRQNDYPKCTADRTFFNVMIDDGVPFWKAKLMYFAVRFFA